MFDVRPRRDKLVYADPSFAWLSAGINPELGAAGGRLELLSNLSGFAQEEK